MRMIVARCLGLIVISLCALSLSESRPRRRYNRYIRRVRPIPGYCRPTVHMIVKGLRRAVPVGKTVKPNLCVDCTCTSTGSFKCCLSRKNAGKTFIYPGELCTRCKCADLPYTKNFYLPESVLEKHCFRGSNLMTCETNVCVHPLVADPNCIQVKTMRNQCCSRCVRSGCYVMLNDTALEAQNNQLAIDDYQKKGVEMIKMEFGESIQTGCIRGTCMPPDFMFRGGFVIDNSSCSQPQSIRDFWNYSPP